MTLEEHTEILTKALHQLETTLHQDALLVLMALGALLLVLCLVLVLRR
jgi:hypothetical protein